MREYEKLGIEYEAQFKNPLIDPKALNGLRQGFEAGFLKAREMAIYSHMHSTDDTPLHDLLTLGEKEV